MEEEHYTVKQFAEKMGVSKQSVYSWIDRGLLQAERRKIGDFTLILISRSVADEFRQPPMGRPRKKS